MNLFGGTPFGEESRRLEEALERLGTSVWSHKGSGLAQFTFSSLLSKEQVAAEIAALYLTGQTTVEVYDDQEQKDLLMAAE